MSDPESNAIHIDEVLLDRLKEKVYQLYQKTHRYHYWLWKYHRISDEHTLRTMRSILYYSKVLTLLRHPEWKINRSSKEYETTFGSNFVEHMNTTNLEKFSGKEDPL